MQRPLINLQAEITKIQCLIRNLIAYEAWLQIQVQQQKPVHKLQAVCAGCNKFAAEKYRYCTQCYKNRNYCDVCKIVKCGPGFTKCFNCNENCSECGKKKNNLNKDCMSCTL